MKKKSAGHLIEKGRSTNFNTQFTEVERKNFIALAYEYLSSKCAQIERSYLVTVSKLVVFAMPLLRDNTKGDHAGYVS